MYNNNNNNNNDDDNNNKGNPSTTVQKYLFLINLQKWTDAKLRPDVPVTTNA